MLRLLGVGLLTVNAILATIVGREEGVYVTDSVEMRTIVVDANVVCGSFLRLVEWTGVAVLVKCHKAHLKGVFVVVVAL